LYQDILQSRAKHTPTQPFRLTSHPEVSTLPGIEIAAPGITFMHISIASSAETGR